MANPADVEVNSRQIRVFLSSTFRDFMEERDLLVKQVFPALRRRAQERGVEIVDVDLRWGITEEESQQGKVIGICLAEIERCRPYFIGMLGERYGWTPPPDTYPDELFEREQLQWLRDHRGGASVTELEILHGVLNDKEMAGRAFFYFRDPAWSQSQSEPGFVCDTPEEEQKLADLKQRITNSGFPVKKDLADPQAIADQIEADLWELIEELYPDVDTADALEREERKHASYRQSRLGVYLGKEYVRQLEGLIQAGEKKILITGESGSGKSALLANWMAAHQASHPEDGLFAHHLGCSNDANAIRPLLARMLDTASRLLVEHELISEPIKVPEDWWELTAKIAETLQDLGRWCKATGHRWIWVLDGLDRLDAENQQALPWLPLLIPDGVGVVISALDCQAKTILQERQFQLLEIGPLQRIKQEQLIETYLERYTKKLNAERLQQILACDLAKSPLFLQVLLDELRQCGRFETLQAQIAEYIRPNADGSLAVNDIYGRVLARLESDCGAEPVRKALTALWASRAGLSEPELLAITGLAPLQWAPIDLALENAFSRNGNRLVFDHDYLRNAVQDRYVPTEEQKRDAHSDMAYWYQDRDGWDRRDSEELPWQLLQAGRLEDLRDLLLMSVALANLQWDCGSREVINYWLVAKREGDGELDELIAEGVEEEIEMRNEDIDDFIWFVDRIAALLDEAGLYRDLLLRLRTLSLELEQKTDEREEASLLTSLACLASTHIVIGNYEEAAKLYMGCLEACERLLGSEHPFTLANVGNLGNLFQVTGDFKQAMAYYNRCLEAKECLLGSEHPSTLTTVGNLATLFQAMGDYEQAEACYSHSLEHRERLLGSEHPSTLTTVGNLATLFQAMGDYEQAEGYHRRCLAGLEQLLGCEHPSTLTSVANLAGLFRDKGDYEKAEAFYIRCLEATERLLGSDHPETLTTVSNLAGLLHAKGDYEKAEAFYSRCLEAFERLLGPEHPSTLTTASNLGLLYTAKGDYEQAEAFYTRCLEARERLLGPEHPDTLSTVGNLASLYQDKGDYEQAETFYTRCLEASERLLGPEHPSTLTTIGNLGLLYTYKGNYEKAEVHLTRCLEASERLLGAEHPETLTTMGNLATLYRAKSDYEKAEAYYSRCLEAHERLLGSEHPSTLITIGNLATLYRAKGDYGQAEALSNCCLAVQERLLGLEHPDTLTSVGNLAALLTDKGDYKQAESFYTRCLEARERLLGPEHPSTLTTVGNLGNLYRAKGDYEQAEALYTRCLEASERLLGPEHPDTLTTVGNLGLLYSEKGDYEQAEAFYTRCLEARERLLGPEHPSTLTTVGNLAGLYQDKGDYEQAEEYYRRDLEASERLLGPEHPSTLTTVGNLAGLYQDKGDVEQAEAYYTRCLEASERLLGPEHPDTLSATYNLAKVLSQQGRPAEAIPLRRRELAWCREQNGDTDPGTLTSINGLAIDLRETGELEEAEALFRELLAARQQVLEPSDFGIGRALGGLAKTVAAAGKLDEAVAVAQQALDHRLQYEGADRWHTNLERLDLARLLHTLERSAEAISLLDQLTASLSRSGQPDADAQDLLNQAADLRRSINKP